MFYLFVSGFDLYIKGHYYGFVIFICHCTESVHGLSYLA